MSNEHRPSPQDEDEYSDPFMDQINADREFAAEMLEKDGFTEEAQRYRDLLLPKDYSDDPEVAEQYQDRDAQET